jgi:hypothetical protein
MELLTSKHERYKEIQAEIQKPRSSSIQWTSLVDYQAQAGESDAEADAKREFTSKFTSPADPKQKQYRMYKKGGKIYIGEIGQPTGTRAPSSPAVVSTVEQVPLPQIQIIGPARKQIMIIKIGGKQTVLEKVNQTAEEWKSSTQAWGGGRPQVIDANTEVEHLHKGTDKLILVRKPFQSGDGQRREVLFVGKVDPQQEAPQRINIHQGSEAIDTAPDLTASEAIERLRYEAGATGQVITVNPDANITEATRLVIISRKEVQAPEMPPPGISSWYRGKQKEVLFAGNREVTYLEAIGENTQFYQLILKPALADPKKIECIDNYVDDRISFTTKVRCQEDEYRVVQIGSTVMYGKITSYKGESAEPIPDSE